MKWHSTKEQAFEHLGLDAHQWEAFCMGWYCAGSQINNGLDADWIQEELKANDFLDNTQD